MNFSNVRLACCKHGIKYDAKCYNAIRFHDSNETLLHFLAKARICKALFDAGQSFFSELSMNHSVCDLYWLESGAVIEIQGDMSQTAVFKKHKLFEDHELWLLPLSDFEKDFEGALSKWLNKIGL